MVESETRTVMIMDICDYTPLSSSLMRETLDRLHDIVDGITLPTVEENFGKIIKKLGDGFLITFKSPTDALLCATALQGKFMRYNREFRLRKPLRIKIAIHTGEVVVRKGDIFGDAVNIASRLEGLTKPDQIYFSNSVFSAMNQNEIPCVYVGIRNVKGVKNPIKIFRVKQRFEDALRKRMVAKRIFGRVLFWAIVLLLVYFIFKII